MPLARSLVEAWYRAYGACVLRRARVILGSDSLAEEALHEVFILVMRFGDRFRDEGSPLTWIYRVTTNHCLDVLRRQALAKSWLGQTANLPPELSRPDGDAVVLLRQLLSRADRMEASAAIYVFVDQMTYDEVAPLLGVSRRTVGNWVERFRAKARCLAEGEAMTEPMTEPTADPMTDKTTRQAAGEARQPAWSKSADRRGC